MKKTKLLLFGSLTISTLLVASTIGCNSKQENKKEKEEDSKKPKDTRIKTVEKINVDKAGLKNILDVYLSDDEINKLLNFYINEINAVPNSLNKAIYFSEDVVNQAVNAHATKILNLHIKHALKNKTLLSSFKNHFNKVVKKQEWLFK
ncbi:hypothetical protein [Mycoplasma elephantis]|uniref:hypothetical protein n=1 Tax=Mycoplasma elephantis TaxID=114882 RepID=UPI000480827F|nr:hypothetical protein [Mycoplasma elephantis]